MITWIPSSQKSYIPLTAMKFSQKTDHELFNNIWMRFSLNGDNYFCYTIQESSVWDKDFYFHFCCCYSVAIIIITTTGNNNIRIFLSSRLKPRKLNGTHFHNREILFLTPKPGFSWKYWLKFAISFQFSCAHW